MRLPIASERRLKRMANRHGWTTSDTGARLVEEGLRRTEFAHVDFRDSPMGRQACIQGSTLAVWEVVMLARKYDHNPAKVAKHLQWPEVKVRAALNYAKAFPNEIDQALSDNDSVNFESLSQMLPHAEAFTVQKRAKKR